MKKLIILVPVIFALCSCGPKPENTQIDYITKNISAHDVKLIIFYYNCDSFYTDTIISIPKNGEIIKRYIDQYIGNSPFSLNDDSANIVFDNVKQISYKKGDGQSRNILDINNYEGGKVTEYYYKYQYEITDEDYANAVEIK